MGMMGMHRGGELEMWMWCRFEFGIRFRWRSRLGLRVWAEALFRIVTSCLWREGGEKGSLSEMSPVKNSASYSSERNSSRRNKVNCDEIIIPTHIFILAINISLTRIPFV